MFDPKEIEISREKFGKVIYDWFERSNLSKVIIWIPSYRYPFNDNHRKVSFHFVCVTMSDKIRVNGNA